MSLHQVPSATEDKAILTPHRLSDIAEASGSNGQGIGTRHFPRRRTEDRWMVGCIKQREFSAGVVLVKALFAR